MRGRKERGQLEWVITGSLQDLVPEDRGQVRVDDIPDLSWLPGAVAGRSCAAYGRPGIDAEVAVRLMPAGFRCGIVHDRPLMRKAQINLAIRWFIGCALHAALRDHSALTRIRHCWGEDVFHRVLTPVVRQCPLAGPVPAETVHIDASLIRANVSMDAPVARHLDAVGDRNDAAREARMSGRFKARLDAIEDTLGVPPDRITADTIHGVGRV